MSSDNQLPKELRAQLLSIAIWVNKYSVPAMKSEASLEPLISVNKQIMEGLRGAPQAGNKTTEVPAEAQDVKIET